MKVRDIFDIDYGQSLSLNKLRTTEPGSGIAFVSRTARNNGISAWVEPIEGVQPLPSGLLTVSLRSRNHALATFVQPRDFYCGYHIYVLTPKHEISLQEKLWWAQCITANRYRYNFGRQANRSFEIPDAIPSWVTSTTAPNYSSERATGQRATLHTETWQPFEFHQIFELKRGRNVLKRTMRPGPTAYVSASAIRNGVMAWIDEVADHPGGQMTVNSNGSVGEAFFQPKPFIASGDVTVLVPKRPITEATALFLCTLIRAEKYRWNYGRKWGPNRMKESVIRLPVRPNGEPDWDWMDQYVAHFPLFGVLQGQSASHNPGR